MKKLYLLISIILIFFIIFLIIVITPKNYKINYIIDDFNVEEKYLKDNKAYIFTINYQNNIYPLFIDTKYTTKRKLIKNIKVFEDENNICLNITTNSKEALVCTKDGVLTSIDAMPKEFLENIIGRKIKIDTIKDEYNKIDIYNSQNTFLIWNYKGFYYISPQEKENTKIFVKDNYKNYLAYQTDKYLVFPNYDSEYYFQKLYIYDVKSNTLNDINFNYEISYDSYYLGIYKNRLYLIDKKNKDEYEINLKKKKIEKISKDGVAKYLNNGEFKDVSINKLINENSKFKYKNNYNYILEDNTLYLEILNYKIKVSDKKVKQIVYTSGKKVFYLSEDKLYQYEYLNNEELLLKNEEWNFNYNNHIFIFN